MAFEPPSEKTRLEAIGNTSKLSKKEQAAFNPIGFEPIGEPDFGDWLFTQDEPGQTFYRFLKAGPPRPDATRSIYYDCLMNGSNSIEEKDELPLHLCPCDLRKLSTGVPNFDVVARYKALSDYYSQKGMQLEAAWTKRQIEKIKAAR